MLICLHSLPDCWTHSERQMLFPRQPVVRARPEDKTHDESPPTSSGDEAELCN